MSIVLCRIDDRLIHGQVVIGWGRPLGINLIILVDDQVAQSDWEQELYRMAVDPDIEVRFASVADAAAHLQEWQTNGKRGLVLTGDLESMAALHSTHPRSSTGSTSVASIIARAVASGCPTCT